MFVEDVAADMLRLAPGITRQRAEDAYRRMLRDDVGRARGRWRTQARACHT